jgi:hypothetical protein
MDVDDSSNAKLTRRNRSTLGYPALTEDSSSKTPHNGCLRATILSAYDLTVRDPPSQVTISVGSQTVFTGPPVQRHKDRNSFKFSNSSSTAMTLQAPLPTLYQAKAVVRLVYANQPQQTLSAEYALDQLKMHETTWLILQMDPVSTSPDSNNKTQDANGTDDDSARPSLRLQMTLEGPYRTEIAAVVHICNSWFGLIDALEKQLTVVSSKLPHIRLPDAKYILIPAAPILAITVVSLPVVMGVLIMGLPMFLPMFVAVGTVVAAVVAAWLLVYASTRAGRAHLQSVLQPVAHTLLSTHSGQRLVYQTGPRPTPVKVAKMILPNGIWGKLMTSLLIDAIGSSSYLLPVVGEGFDIAWAPMQTILLMAMYDSTSPNLKYLSFVEEILPLTDIVPTGTLGWLMEFAYPLALNQLGMAGKHNEPSSSLLVTHVVSPAST